MFVTCSASNEYHKHNIIGDNYYGFVYAVPHVRGGEETNGSAQALLVQGRLKVYEKYKKTHEHNPYFHLRKGTAVLSVPGIKLSRYWDGTKKLL